MREIKFRAWDKDNECMCAVLLFSLYGEDSCIIPVSSSDKSYWQHNNCLEFLQYTGRKDKNGSEIYEGDIDKNDGVIRWSEDDLAFVTDIRLLHKLHEPEIIGNIYQNSEHSGKNR